MSTLTLPTIASVPNPRMLPQPEAKWMKDASCAQRQDLPWVGVATPVSELAPTAGQQREMAQVCADCPILTTCARYALSSHSLGGFYAGIWLPWPQQGGAPRARRILRSLVRST